MPFLTDQRVVEKRCRHGLRHTVIEPVLEICDCSLGRGVGGGERRRDIRSLMSAGSMAFASRSNVWILPSPRTMKPMCLRVTLPAAVVNGHVNCSTGASGSLRTELLHASVNNCKVQTCYVAGTRGRGGVPKAKHCKVGSFVCCKCKVNLRTSGGRIGKEHHKTALDQAANTWTKDNVAQRRIKHFPAAEMVDMATGSLVCLEETLAYGIRQSLADKAMPQCLQQQNKCVCRCSHLREREQGGGLSGARK